MELLSDYEKKMTELAEMGKENETKILYKLLSINIRQYEAKRDSNDKINFKDKKERLKFLNSMLKKYSAFTGNETIDNKSDNAISERKSSLRDLVLNTKVSEEQEATKKGRQFIDRKDIDLLFPTQLKSYYASSEF
jgi:hypothetical protein